MMLDEQGDLSVIGLLEDEYEIVAELGRGGSAVVYRGRDRALGRDVAIKVVQSRAGHVDDENIARLAREARTVAQLQHPLIVSVYAVKRIPNGLALVMQWVPGRTLKQRIIEEGALSPEMTEQVMRDVATALAYAHAHGVVHRDVKPENIFLDAASGRALLSDFGIAHSAEFDSRLTMTGTAIGTPAYMSPEQIDGGAANARSDVYSLGLVAWEMLAGQRPWEGESLYSVLFKQKHDELPSLDEMRDDVPERLQYIIERGLQKKPAARWAGADGLLAHLDATILPPDWKQWRAARRKRRVRRDSDQHSRVPAFLASAMQTIRFRRPDADDAVYTSDARVATPVGADALDAPSALPAEDDDAPSWMVQEDTRSRSRYRMIGVAVALLLVVAAAAGGWQWWNARGATTARTDIASANGVEPSGVEVPVVTPERGGLQADSAAASLTRDTTQPLSTTAFTDSLRADSMRAAGFATTLAATRDSALVDSLRRESMRVARLRADAAIAANARETRAALDSQRAVAAVMSRTPTSSRAVAPTPASVATAPPAAAVRVIRATDDAGVIAAGGRHSCQLISGDAFCWGANEQGQLGAGEYEMRATPVRVSGELDFVQLSAGVSHSCGVTRSGDAYCWGADQSGQLGDATRISRNAPVRVASNLDFRRVVAGRNHSCGLTKGDLVACWGANGKGELGDGTSTSRSTPLVISSAMRFASIAVGWQHSCGLTVEGMAVCWGENSSGQLGDGSTLDRSTPTSVQSGVRFTSIAAGSAHTCAVSTGGDLFCWGRNSYGQLGTGNTVNRSTPAPVSSLSNFVSVAAGSVHSCARTSNGAVYCWGRNNYGQLGDATLADRTTPVRAAGTTTFSAINVSGAHSCGMSTAGEAWCWGYNVDGQIGDGSRVHQQRPARVSAPSAGGR